MSTNAHDSDTDLIEGVQINRLRAFDPPELLPPQPTFSTFESISENRQTVHRILHNNIDAQEDLQITLAWLLSSPLDTIYHPDTNNRVTQEEFNEYTNLASELLRQYERIIASQTTILETITKKFQREFQPSEGFSPSPSVHDTTMRSIDPNTNHKSDQRYIKLPKSVVRYTSSNSRNVNEFFGHLSLWSHYCTEQHNRNRWWHSCQISFNCSRRFISPKTHWFHQWIFHQKQSNLASKTISQWSHGPLQEALRAT